MNIVYFITLFITMFLSIIGTRLNKKNNNKPTKLFVFFIILVLVLISGFRDLTYIGGDEAVYRIEFKAISYNPDMVNNLDKEFVFYYIIYILTLISSNSQILIFICALITNILIVLTLYKYSKHFTFSLFLYISLGMYFTSFNIMRQYLALSICFWAIRYIFDKKTIKYCICILIASLIHSSAIILIPIYFICRLLQFKNKYWLFLMITIIIAIFFDKFMGMLQSFSNNNLYSNYADWYFNEKKGVNLIRIIVSIMPCFFMLINKKEIIRDDDNKFLLYFSVLAAGISIISANFIYVARINPYFSIINLLLYPQILDIVSNRDKKLFICFIIIAFYILWGFIDNSGIKIFYLGSLKINGI